MIVRVTAVLYLVAFSSGISTGWSRAQPTIEQRIDWLERHIAREPDRIDLLYLTSSLYEQNEQYAPALNAARKILAFGESYDVHLRLGWLNMLVENHSESGEHYKRASELVEQSEDAWLGLQWARICEGRWGEAAEAGKKVITINPRNYWAVSRQGYIRYMQREYDAAEQLYRRALEIDPESGEVLLGLGFTRVFQGEVEEGRKLCQKAGDYLKGDPRIDECLSIEPPAEIAFTGSIFGTYLHYTDPWNLRNLKSLTATMGMAWPFGFGLWVGANLSEAALRYELDDFWQSNPVLGVYYVRSGFSVAGSASWIFSNDDVVNNAAVAVLEAGYDGEVVGGGAGFSGSFYKSFNVFQIEPQVRLHFGEKVDIVAGPRLIVVGGDSPERSNRKKDSELLWSGRLGLRWLPISIASVFVSGFYGAQSFAVEARGLSVWSSRDRYIGGYRVGAGVDIGEHFSLTAELRHQFGVEQYGLNHDFSLLGGMVGLYGRF